MNCKKTVKYGSLLSNSRIQIDAVITLTNLNLVLIQIVLYEVFKYSIKYADKNIVFVFICISVRINICINR